MPKFFVFIICIFVVSASFKSALAAESESGPQSILFTNVRTLDFAGDAPVIAEGVSVLINDGKIVEINNSIETPAHDDALTIDGQGQTLIPGLTDMHVHVWDKAELGAYLSYGVTTVRNASGMPFLLALQTEIENGTIFGPRLITTGPILNGTGPNTQINHQIVDTAEAAELAVRSQYDAGYRHLKVYSNLPRESYEAIRIEAEKLGMTIMGHSPEGVRDPGIPHEKPFNISFEELLDDGFTTFEHMETIVWHALYDDFNENKARALAAKIVDAGVAITPTLLAYRNLVCVAQTDGDFLSRTGVEMLNPFISETEQDSYDHWASRSPKSLLKYDAFYLRATKIFHEEGVSLVAGTDAGIFTNIPGASLLTELELLVEAGLTPYEALQAATYNAAKALGEEDKIGRIAPGYRADLVLIGGDPLTDISLLKEPAGVVLNGVWLNAASLNDLRDKASQTSYERTQKNVMEGLEAQQ